MGPDARQRDRPSREGSADEGQARQPLRLHHHPGRQGEVHHRPGGEGWGGAVERGVLLWANAWAAGGGWDEQQPGAQSHASRADRARRVSRSSCYSLDKVFQDGMCPRNEWVLKLIVGSINRPLCRASLRFCTVAVAWDIDGIRYHGTEWLLCVHKEKWL